MTSGPVCSGASAEVSAAGRRTARGKTRGPDMDGFSAWERATILSFVTVRRGPVNGRGGVFGPRTPDAGPTVPPGETAGAGKSDIASGNGAAARYNAATGGLRPRDRTVAL